MKKACKIFLEFLLYWAPLWVRAQSLPVDTLQVKVIAQEQGLSQLNALALSFDKRGYLWVGTENGLNRFNAYEMKTFFASSREGGLLDDHIRDMVYTQDTLWLATNTHALMAYIPRKNTFLNFDQKLNFNKNPDLKYGNTLYEFDKNLLILGTNAHCVVLNRKTLNLEARPLPAEAAQDYVTAMVKVGTYDLWVGTHAHGLFHLNLNTGGYTPVAFPISRIHALTRLGDKILTATAEGLWTYDLKKKEWAEIKINGKSGMEVHSISPWDGQQVFVSTGHVGYILEGNKTLRRILYRNSVNKEIMPVEVVSVKKDDQGGIWLATKGRGIFYYHPHAQKFKPLRIKAGAAPRADFISIFNFLRDDNSLWMATEFGYARYNMARKEYQFYPTEGLQYTLAKDEEGQLWGGGFETGLVRYNRAVDRFESVKTKIPDQDVIQITPINRDTIWVHTWSAGIFGLNVHDLGSRHLSLEKNGLIRSRTSFRDSRGRLWLGSDEGIFYLDKKRLIPVGGLSNKRVFAITEGSDGNIWVGTAKGMNRIDPQTGKVTQFTRKSGLPNDFIYGIEGDAEGNIWVSTNFGLSRYNIEKKTFRNYTEEDGLQNNEFNGKASYRDKNGRLYFGGMNGFNIVTPDSLFVSRKVGKTFIEDVLLFGKSLEKNFPFVQKLEFSYRENVITFKFASLNYLWNHKNQYRFKLVGFDKDWRDATTETSTTYTNLNPGTYVFEVMGSNSDLLWGIPDRLTLVIHPPWYATWWFRILSAALLISLILGFYFYKLYQQKRINLRLVGMVRERTGELVQTNKALEKSLQTSEKQRESIAMLMRELNHRVKNNLQIITSLIDIQDLSISDPQAKERLRMLQSRIFTISRMHDVLSKKEGDESVRLDRFIENISREIIAFSGQTINLELDLVNLTTKIDKLTYLGLILNELITNSLKHAFTEAIQNPTISLELSETGKKVRILYHDNGTGFDVQKEEEKSMGLNLIHFLTKELKGKIERLEGEGTTYILTFSKSAEDGK